MPTSTEADVAVARRTRRSCWRSSDGYSRLDVGAPRPRHEPSAGAASAKTAFAVGFDRRRSSYTATAPAAVAPGAMAQDVDHLRGLVVDDAACPAPGSGSCARATGPSLALSPPTAMIS